jgi:hypothetical protein
MKLTTRNPNPSRAKNSSGIFGKIDRFSYFFQISHTAGKVTEKFFNSKALWSL